MLNIKFKGEDFIFTGDSLDESGAIATLEDYRTGEASYAHLFRDGRVKRFCEVVGNRSDIEVLGVVSEPKMSTDEYFNAIDTMLTSPSWDRPHAVSDPPPQKEPR